MKISKWLRRTLENAAKPPDPLGGYKPRMMSHDPRNPKPKRKPKQKRWW